ncbi:hypothetical protein, conserved [Leishmania tarentolae]|uniref:Uncharacterized protein n=1 Tax=Leishmania tarentolae TaxID=5689 RepID=A0A640KPR9_LEITA|nr:hypothetical protein, conserved [Leishmania tarentolae]
MGGLGGRRVRRPPTLSDYLPMRYGCWRSCFRDEATPSASGYDDSVLGWFIAFTHAPCPFNFCSGFPPHVIGTRDLFLRTQTHTAAMSQLYSAGADTTGEAYVDIRVCDLIIQQSKIPKGVGSDFQIDGLYVVLRCQGEVRRTSCLWPSASGACSTELQRSAVPLAGAAGAYEEQSEEDLVWSELFRFIVPPALPLTSSATSRGGPHSPPSADGGNSQGGFCAPGTPPMHSAAAQQQSPGCGNSTIATETEINNAPLLHPAIELELWRSTRLSENLLGQYTYHVPMELMQSGYPLGNLDAVVERVVLLHTKEAPSIMGNLYGWNGIG